MIEDKRIALAIKTAGYQLEKSGLVVASPGHLRAVDMQALVREVTKLTETFPFLFIDLLCTTGMALTSAEQLVKKYHHLSLNRKRELILLDPLSQLMQTIYNAQRVNGLATSFPSLYTINPNPKVRINS